MEEYSNEWFFHKPEIRAWLDERSSPAKAEGARCTCCGGELDPVGLRHGDTCGYCLAYEYGTHTESRRLAGAVSTLIRVAVEDHEAFAHLTSQLADEVSDLAEDRSSSTLIGS